MARPNEYHWILAGGDRLHFDAGQNPEVFLEDCLMMPFEGCSVYSDENGDLIAYSDGVRVWDQFNDVVFSSPNVAPNTPSHLGGDTSTTQSCIFVPPAGPNGQNIHLFTVGGDNHGDTDHIKHSTYAFSNGVVSQQIPPTIISTAFPLPPGYPSGKAFDNTERLAVISHADCQSRKYWLVLQLTQKQGFYSVLIDSDQSPSTFVYSSTAIGTNSQAGNLGYGTGRPESGYMKISPDGTLLAYAQRDMHNSGPDNFVCVHSFDRSTGLITDLYVINGINEPYGLEFSPSSKILYIATTTGSIFAYDTTLGAGAPLTQIFPPIGTTLPNLPREIGAINLGPDDVIYAKISTENNIHNMIAITASNNIGAPSVQYPAKDRFGDDIELTQENSMRFGLPTFTRIADDCANAKCGLELMEQICDNDGNTSITVKMENLSSNTNVTLSLELSGIPRNMYSVTTTVSGNIHTAVINIDGIFSGPITVKGDLSGFAGSVGARLCCSRELKLQIDACADDCMEIVGSWRRRILWPFSRKFDFTITSTSANNSFNPTQVDITNLPPGYFLNPNPLIMSQGSATGTITVPWNFSKDMVLGLLFHSEDMDMCCNKWFNLQLRQPRFLLPGGLLGKFSHLSNRG